VGRPADFAERFPMTYSVAAIAVAEQGDLDIASSDDPRLVNTREDIELIDAIARADHEAFVELHGRYLGRCAKVARRVLAQEEGVADVIQSVFLDVWRRAARYDIALGTVASWLLAVTHHRAVDYVRREEQHRRRRVLAAPFWQEASTEVDPAAWVLRSAEQQRVADALAELTPKQREVLVLSYYGGHTQREIARLLNAPLGTVKSRARDGLRQLREQLGKENAGGD